MSATLLENGELHIASVVLATDLSPVSANAGAYAAALAIRFRAQLVVTNAFLPSQGAEEVEVLKQRPSADRVAKTEQLRDAAAGFAASGLDVRTQLLDGDPSELLPTFADSLPQALLVLGTHGGRGIGRRLIGSVAERVLRRAACPTLTIGPNASAPQPGSLFQKVLYATDCSPMATMAAPLACALAKAFHSELKVLSIIEEEQGAVPALLADLDFRAQQEIDRLMPGACDHFTDTRAMTKPDRASEEILRYVDDMHSDLLLLGIHRRAAIAGHTFGDLMDRNSIVIQLIVRATCPVLTLTRDTALAAG